MDKNFVGMPPRQRSHFLVCVALGQPEHLLLAQAEQVGSQVVAVKEVHYTVSGNHGEADSEETILHVYLLSVHNHNHLPQKLVSNDFFTMLVAKVYMTNHQHPENDNHKRNQSEE